MVVTILASAWNHRVVKDQTSVEVANESETANTTTTTRSFLESVDTAFHLATLRGPLCAEPMEGLAFFIEKLDISSSEESQEICRWIDFSRIKFT